MTVGKEPLLHDNFFNIIKNKRTFHTHIQKQYEYEMAQGYLVPILSERVIDDVHACYIEDVKRMDSKMKTSPDHFKRAGVMAYWLRRHNPVTFVQESGIPPNNNYKRARDFLSEHGHVYLAFAMGYKICRYYISESSGDYDMPLPTPNYLKSICYLMKYKSVSPHSLGFIYRSLFFGFGGSK